MSPAASTRTPATVEALPPSIPPPAAADVAVAVAPGEHGVAKLPRNSSCIARFASTLQSAQPVDAGAPWVGAGCKSG